MFPARLRGRGRAQFPRKETVSYTHLSLAISLILPHYWYDPYMAVGKNIVLMVATLWLLGDEPRAREARG